MDLFAPRKLNLFNSMSLCALLFFFFNEMLIDRVNGPTVVSSLWPHILGILKNEPIPSTWTRENFVSRTFFSVAKDHIKNFKKKKKCLRFYTTVSWMLVEDMRFLGQRQMTLLLIAQHIACGFL